MLGGVGLGSGTTGKPRRAWHQCMGGGGGGGGGGGAWVLHGVFGSCANIHLKRTLLLFS